MFTCETPGVKQILEKLKALTLKEGAYFHPNINIAEKGGNFTLTCASPRSSGEYLIRMPESCLPDTKAFTMEEKDDSIIINSHDDSVSDVQIECFRLQIELYNLTRKLSFYKKNSLYFALADRPEDIRTVLSADSHIENNALYRLWEKGDTASLSIEGFLKSRVFRWENEANGKTKHVLLPFIDLLNHHLKAGKFQKERNGEKEFLSVANTHPVEGSSECFVQYSPLDTVSALIGYGFADESAHFLYSVPVEIDLGYGKFMKINSATNAKYKRTGSIPDAMKDIASHIPGRLFFDRDKGIELTHLIVPGATVPAAMRRILGMYIHSLFPNKEELQKRLMLQHAETSILLENRKYYDALKKISESLSNSASFTLMLKKTADMQLEKLDAYEERLVSQPLLKF